MKIESRFILIRYIITVLLLISIFINTQPALAKDIVRIIKPHSKIDQRHLYNNAILSKALEKTIPVYDDYEIKLTHLRTQRRRAIVELISGQKINVHIVPTQLEWEEKTLPIRIPIVKGLLSYRLFLIKNQNIKLFSGTKSIVELKALRAGLRQQWSTTKAMKELDFKVITGSDYEGLFLMLVNDRFDYFPRGVNEIFSEYSLRKQKFPSMVIEQSKVLYLPMPTYIFVCPKYPKLAERIEKGLRIMIQDGSFDKLFWEFYETSIKQANFSQRQIFKVNNPFLPPDTPFEKKDLWFNPMSTP